MTDKALQFAELKHRGQTRKGAAQQPYITHPIAVRDVLIEHGIIDHDVLEAAILHDTIEDTATTADELRAQFGERVTEIVLAVTDDKSLPKAERKRLQVEHAAHLPHGAKLVKLADKLCNVRDVIDNPPPWPIERRREYLDWARRVVHALGSVDTPLLLTFHREIDRGVITLREQK